MANTRYFNLKSTLSGFSIAEMMITLSLVGILAVTMIVMNKCQNHSYEIAKINITKTDEAIKTWGKEITRTNESGLGAYATVNSQETLLKSIQDNFDTTGEIKNVRIPSLKLYNLQRITLGNGVKIYFQYTYMGNNIKSIDTSVLAWIIIEADTGTKSDSLTKLYWLKKDKIETKSEEG